MCNLSMTENTLIEYFVFFFLLESNANVTSQSCFLSIYYSYHSRSNFL
jgi:hypothetical protein